MTQFTVTHTDQYIKIPQGRYMAKIAKAELRQSKSGNPYLSMTFKLKMPGSSRTSTVWDMFPIAGKRSQLASALVRAIYPEFKPGQELSTEGLIDKVLELDVYYDPEPFMDIHKTMPRVKACYPVIQAGTSQAIRHEMIDRHKTESFDAEDGPTGLPE